MTLKLCYVRRPWAYFTTQELSEQWGDNWRSVPYEHNAEKPYGPSDADKKEGRVWEIMKLAWEGDLEAPCDLYQPNSSPFSLEAINKGACAWLQTGRESLEEKVFIRAGVSPIEFVRLVQKVGGHVYADLGLAHSLLTPLAKES